MGARGYGSRVMPRSSGFSNRLKDNCFGRMEGDRRGRRGIWQGRTYSVSCRGRRRKSSGEADLIGPLVEKGGVRRQATRGQGARRETGQAPKGRGQGQTEGARTLGGRARGAAETARTPRLAQSAMLRTTSLVEGRKGNVPGGRQGMLPTPVAGISPQRSTG